MCRFCSKVFVQTHFNCGFTRKISFATTSIQIQDLPTHDFLPRLNSLGFAQMQLTTLPLMVASTLVDLRAGSKTAHMATGSVTKSLNSRISIFIGRSRWSAPTSRTRVGRGRSRGCGRTEPAKSSSGRATRSATSTSPWRRSVIDKTSASRRWAPSWCRWASAS